MNLIQHCVVLLEFPSYTLKLFEDEIANEDPVSKWLRGGIDGRVGEACRRYAMPRDCDNRILSTATDR